MSGIALGIDLGGTAIKSVLARFGEDVDILEARMIPTPNTGTRAVLDAIAAVAADAIGHYGVDSIGATFPGILDPASGAATVVPNLPGEWTGVCVGAELDRRVGRPVALINDARAFALAEAVVGAGSDHRVVAAIALGTGVGGGIAIDGQLYGGATGTAGEIGHQTVVADGPLCGCGNRGCLEAVAKVSELCRLSGVDSAHEVFEAAASGETAALAAIETITGHLAIGIGNAVALVAPDVIVVGGGVADAGEQLFGPLRAAVRRRIHLVAPDDIVVVPARFGANAGAVGAALAGARQRSGGGR